MVRRIFIFVIGISLLVLSIGCKTNSSSLTSTTTMSSSPTSTFLSVTTTTPTFTQTATTTQTPDYMLSLENFGWGKGTSSMSLGGVISAESTFLDANGSAQNVGSEILLSVICVAQYWSAGTLVKTQNYVVGAELPASNFVAYQPIFPGQSFDFDIQIPYDPTIDNVTMEFTDSAGNIIPCIGE